MITTSLSSSNIVEVVESQVLFACPYFSFLTSELVLATSGQPLVRHGEVMPLEQIAEEWYDPRHLVTPLRIAINDATLFVPQAQFQHGLLRKALCQPVHMRLEAQVDEETILPLSASGWVQIAKDTSLARAQVTSFLKQQGLLNGEDSLDQGLSYWLWSKRRRSCWKTL